MWLEQADLMVIKQLLSEKKEREQLSEIEHQLDERIRCCLNEIERKKECVVLCDEFVQRMEGFAKEQGISIAFQIQYTANDEFYWINHNLKEEPDSFKEEMAKWWNQMFWEAGFQNVVVGYSFEFAELTEMR